MKKILITMAVIASIFIMAGCGILGKNRLYFIVTAADAISHMEEKYGEEFILEDRKPSDILYEQSDLFCHTAEMDREIKEHVQVFVIEEDDGTHLYDNYFGYYIRPQVEEYISGKMKEEFPDVKVLGVPCNDVLPEWLTKESTLKDFLEADAKYTLSASVFIKKDPDTTNEEYEEGIMRFADSFKTYDKRWIFSFYVVSDEIFDMADRHTRDELLHQHIKNGSKPDDRDYFYCSHLTVDYSGERRYRVDE